MTQICIPRQSEGKLLANFDFSCVGVDVELPTMLANLSGIDTKAFTSSKQSHPWSCSIRSKSCVVPSNQVLHPCSPCNRGT